MRVSTLGVEVIRCISAMLWRPFPERSVFQGTHLVDNVVTSAIHARHLVGHYSGHHLRSLVVLRLFFEHPHTDMAVQALAIVEGGVKLDVGRSWRFP